MRARASAPARRELSGGVWWTVLGAPLTATPAIDYFITGLWDLLRGGARVTQPPRADLSRRYAELLADNLGQPGFRELLIVAHDLDARQDLVFALLGRDWRRPFFLRRQTTGLDRRSAEAVDLAGAARDHVLDAVAGALTLPVATDAQLIGFAPESYWRGETHRLTDRPAALVRVLEEVASAGARQVIVVTAAEELGGPHELSRRRAAPRARLGEFLASAEAAAVRDALNVAAPWFDALFVVRPSHNPVTPLDTAAPSTSGRTACRWWANWWTAATRTPIGSSSIRWSGPAASRSPSRPTSSGPRSSGFLLPLATLLVLVGGVALVQELQRLLEDLRRHGFAGGLAELLLVRRHRHDRLGHRAVAAGAADRAEDLPHELAGVARVAQVAHRRRRTTR